MKEGRKIYIYSTLKKLPHKTLRVHSARYTEILLWQDQLLVDHVTLDLVLDTHSVQV